MDARQSRASVCVFVLVVKDRGDVRLIHIVGSVIEKACVNDLWHRFSIDRVNRGFDSFVAYPNWVLCDRTRHQAGADSIFLCRAAIVADYYDFSATLVNTIYNTCLLYTSPSPRD